MYFKTYLTVAAEQLLSTGLPFKTPRTAWNWDRMKTGATDDSTQTCQVNGKDSPLGSAPAASPEI